MTAYFPRALLAVILTAIMAGPASTDSMAQASPNAEQGTSGTPAPIRLSTEQEKSVWQHINRHQIASPPPSQLTVPVGKAVPEDIPLQAIPDDVVAEVPSLKGYDFAIVQDRLLIVNRSDKTVVHVINATLRRNY
jgi:uncharacterized protein DUF1236